jgi:hypothetical protein
MIIKKGDTMLATEKIADAFTAIIEEAEKALKEGPSEELSAGLKTIISIAKHQSDIRGLKSSGCKSHSSCTAKG